MSFTTHCRTLVLLLLFSAYGHASVQTESETRALVENELRYLISKKDFAGLEKFYTPLLSPKERTPSGIWKLSVVAGGIDSLLYYSPDPGYWQNQADFVTEWRKAYPKSTAAMLYASTMYNTQAWQLRGNGMANTVTEAKWPAIKQLANRARKELEAAGEQGKRDPTWYSQFIAVSRLANDGGEQMRNQMISEGIARHPGYYPIYFETIFSLTPKWGGSYEAIDEFIQAAVKNPKNKDGLSLYARTYWYLDQAQTHGELFKLSKAEWKIMKPAFADLVKRYPDSWNMSAFAYFACLAQDYPQAGLLLKQLGSQLQLGSWSSKDGAESSYNVCKAGIEAEQMDPAERARQNEEAQRDSKRLLEEILEATKRKQLKL
ncbi:DUF4034 domain-containing protein [Chitinibacter fontanus]|uniref:DUF4034 domain-containing protein n=1 Tax=Chitinibacter fontanus TaxID=1737446 RepID=A0A7D5ZCK1_9NEIS|nr:DUF4034 domain-containing protein [Chitinibacter fontanus]QLI81605.1 DUF4034 domain-containing protein [Chitinibacter fontanus]